MQGNRAYALLRETLEMCILRNNAVSKRFECWAPAAGLWSQTEKGEGGGARAETFCGGILY